MKTKNKAWFEIKTQEDGKSAEIYVFGLIGDWIDDYFGDAGQGIVTAKSFTDELAKLPTSVKTIKVRINSPGGDAFGGVTIANALRAEQTKGRKVETIIEGLAASAASVIAMGGNVVRMSDNALMMVHSPWSFAIGNADELRAQADILDQVRGTLVKTYQWHSDKDEAELLALIAGPDGQGTWLDADAAIEAGLATEKVEGLKAAASIDPRAVTKLQVPEAYAERVKGFLADESEPEPEPVAEPPAEEAPAADPAPEPAPAQDAPEPEPLATTEAVLTACEAAGLDLAFAKALAGQRLSASKLEAAVTEEKAKRATAAKREDDIRSLCSKHKVDSLAGGLVRSGLTFDEVKAHVLAVTAMVDKVEIDTGINPDHGVGRKPVIDTAAVYRRMNAPAETTKH